jgi:hypothetical protein
MVLLSRFMKLHLGIWLPSMSIAVRRMLSPRREIAVTLALMITSSADLPVRNSPEEDRGHS